MTLLPGEFPYTSSIYGSLTPAGWQGTDARAISASCKNPDRAMQLLNYFDSDEGGRLISCGVKGVDWDVVDGVPQLIGDMLKYAQGDPAYVDYNKKIGAATFNQEFMTGWQWLCADGSQVDLRYSKHFMETNTPAAQTSMAKDFDPSFTYPGQAYDKWVKEGTLKTDTSLADLTALTLAYTLKPQLSEDMQQIDATVGAYFAEHYAELVTAKDDDAFAAARDSMIAQIKNLGEDAVAQASIDSYKAGQQAAANATK